MAEYFSDHFGTLNTDDTVGLSSPEAGYFAEPGIGHGRMRYKRMRANVPDQMAANDVILLGQFRSADRIIELVDQFDDLSVAAATYDLGLRYTRTKAIIDVDLFEDGESVAAAGARADVFSGNALVNLDRGKTLWELAGLSSDPVEQFDLIFTCATGPIDLGGTYIAEAYYTAGD